MKKKIIKKARKAKSPKKALTRGTRKVAKKVKKAAIPDGVTGRFCIVDGSLGRVWDGDKFETPSAGDISFCFDDEDDAAEYLKNLEGQRDELGAYKIEGITLAVVKPLKKYFANSYAISGDNKILHGVKLIEAAVSLKKAIAIARADLKNGISCSKMTLKEAIKGLKGSESDFAIFEKKMKAYV